MVGSHMQTTPHVADTPMQIAPLVADPHVQITLFSLFPYKHMLDFLGFTLDKPSSATSATNVFFHILMLFLIT
jgi:hypothetical protein